MINRLGGGLLFLVLGIFSVLGTSAAAQAERYVPTIWVDPDGCELWIMDDGAEGYMSPHLIPEGLPVSPKSNMRHLKYRSVLWN